MDIWPIGRARCLVLRTLIGRSQMALKWLALALLSLIYGLAGAQSPEQLFPRLSSSVVVVEALSTIGRPVSQGSGVVISASEVVTNCHVVAYRTRLRVTVGTERHSATLRRGVWKWDICVLELNGDLPPSVKPARGASSAPKIGQRVVTIGSPQGLANTVSDGLVSGFRTLNGLDLIQISAPISPGSSGGGLFSMSGELLGITSLGLAAGQNLNFAIPASVIRELPGGPPDFALESDELTELAIVDLIESGRFGDARAVAAAMAVRHPERRQYRFYQAIAYEDPDDRIGALLDLPGDVVESVYSAYNSTLLSAIFQARGRNSRIVAKLYSDDDIKKHMDWARTEENRFFLNRRIDAPVWLEFSMKMATMRKLRDRDTEALRYLDDLQRDRLRRAPKNCYLLAAVQFRADVSVGIQNSSLTPSLALLKECPENIALLSGVLTRGAKIEGADDQQLARIARALGEVSPAQWELVKGQIDSAVVRAAGNEGAGAR